MRDWSAAIAHFERALEETLPKGHADSAVIRKELARARERLAEATTGVYNIEAIIDECQKNGGHWWPRLDLADYVSPCLRLADVPGKGWSFVIVVMMAGG